MTGIHQGKFFIKHKQNQNIHKYDKTRKLKIFLFGTHLNHMINY